MLLVKGLYLAVYLHRIYTTLSVLVSVNMRDLVSYCALLSGWISCLMLGQLRCCGLWIHLVIRAHVSLALCPNRPWCMCHYMRLPIAFWDNQQISLADLTLPLNRNCLLELTYRWYAKGMTKIAKHAQVLDQSVALWGSESAIRG